MQFPSTIFVNIIEVIRLLISRYIFVFQIRLWFQYYRPSIWLCQCQSIRRTWGKSDNIISCQCWYLRHNLQKVTLWKCSIDFFFLIGKLSLCLLPMPILGIQDDGWCNRFVFSRQQLCSIEEDSCANCNINSSENINVIQLYSIEVESEIGENSLFL